MEIVQEALAIRKDSSKSASVLNTAGTWNFIEI